MNASEDVQEDGFDDTNRTKGLNIKEGIKGYFLPNSFEAFGWDPGWIFIFKYEKDLEEEAQVIKSRR